MLRDQVCQSLRKAAPLASYVANGIVVGGFIGILSDFPRGSIRLMPGEFVKQYGTWINAVGISASLALLLFAAALIAGLVQARRRG